MVSAYVCIHVPKNKFKRNLTFGHFQIGNFGDFALSQVLALIRMARMARISCQVFENMYACMFLKMNSNEIPHLAIFKFKF